MNKREATVFTGNNCAKCEVLKSLLEREGISFSAVNVMENMQQARKLGVRTVPTTAIYEGDVLVGTVLSTDVEKIKELLNGN